VNDQESELRRLVNGYQVTQAIHAVVELGIPDLLAGGPRSSTDLAEATSANEDALYRVLRALAAINILDESGDRQFALTDMGELLRSDAPRSLQPWAVFIGRAPHWQAWSNLTHSVRTGENAFRFTHGVDVWEYRRQHLDDSKLFDASMTAQTRSADQAVVAAYDFGKFPVVADVGGGRGAMLAAVLSANPGVRGILFDQAHVVAGAPQLLDAAAVADRCEIVAGNFFESVATGADAYVLKWIIHDWEDPEAVVILQNCRDAMPGEGRILLVERLIEEPGRGREAKWMDLQMLVSAGGRERTRDQFEELFAKAGLRLVSVTPTTAGLAVIEAARAS